MDGSSSKTVISKYEHGIKGYPRSANQVLDFANALDCSYLMLSETDPAGEYDSIFTLMWLSYLNNFKLDKIVNEFVLRYKGSSSPNFENRFFEMQMKKWYKAQNDAKTKEEFFNWLIQFPTNCSFIKEFIDNNPEKYDEILSSATSKAEAYADLYVAAFGYFLDIYLKKLMIDAKNQALKEMSELKNN